MGQKHDILEFEELGVDRRFVLEHVKARTRQLTCLQHAGERVLVNHFAARRIHDEGMRLHHLQAARRKKVIGGRCVRAIDRDDVHAGQHLVE